MAQPAIGVEPYVRTGDDRVAPSYGLKFNGFFEIEREGLAQFSFALSQPEYFGGYAILEARDSLTTPYTIMVPIEQKVSDYVLHFGFSVGINPKEKNSYPVAGFGLRGVMRKIDVTYKASFDKGKYNDKYSSRQPNIPGALNLGFALSGGYWLHLKYLVVYPNLTLGFGSADSRGKHPWNRYPNYAELGLSVMFCADWIK